MISVYDLLNDKAREIKADVEDKIPFLSTERKPRSRKRAMELDALMISPDRLKLSVN